MLDFTGKVVVITGAASGMGLETAMLLAAKGAKVSMADVQEEALKTAAADIEKAGGTVLATVVNVCDRKQVEDWIKKTKSRQQLLYSEEGTWMGSVMCGLIFRGWCGKSRNPNPGLGSSVGEL